MSKTIVIGDIHGCYGPLKNLLDKIPLDPEHDFLIFLGDYVDRGPESKAVIEEILTLQRRVRHLIALKGNHEQMLLNCLAGGECELFLESGGEQTLKSYGINPTTSLNNFNTTYCADLQEKHTTSCVTNDTLRCRIKDAARDRDHIPRAHIDFLHNLLNYWEDDDYIYVHAGIKPGVHITQQSTDWLFWARNNFVNSAYDFGKRVVFGHTAFKTPLIEENKIGIDTGAVYGGRLTCLILPDLEFISVPGLI